MSLIMIRVKCKYYLYLYSNELFINIFYLRTSSRRQQKIRRSKRRIGLRHYCKTASQSLSLEQIHEYLSLLYFE